MTSIASPPPGLPSMCKAMGPTSALGNWVFVQAAPDTHAHLPVVSCSRPAPPLPPTCVPVVSHGEVQVLIIVRHEQGLQRAIEMHLPALHVDGRLPLPAAVRVLLRPLIFWQAIIPCSRREWGPTQSYPAEPSFLRLLTRLGSGASGWRTRGAAFCKQKQGFQKAGWECSKLSPALGGGGATWLVYTSPSPRD